MTPFQILDVVKKYDEILENKWVAASKINDDCKDITDSEMLMHVRWMCQQIPNLIELDKMEKVNRWIGFIQGVLWSQKIFSILEMKEHNS